MPILPSSKIRVAVLRGGPSQHYDASLQTGAAVLTNLREMPDIYEPIDIFISKDGAWHFEGLIHAPHRALRHADIVWNALHGQYGEDGKVQTLLSGLNIPFTGPQAISSALAMNKEMTKQVFNSLSLPTPQHELLLEETVEKSDLVRIFRTYLHPVIVKPSNGRGSRGITRAHTYDELEQAVIEAFNHSPKVLVEEYILGREATCAVIDDARGEKFYALLPVEVEGVEHKVKGGKFSVDEHKRIEYMAKQAHRALGLRHYSDSDFIITPKGKIYILETNALPSLAPESALLESLKSVGWNPKEFVDHVLKLAVKKKSA